MGCAASSTSETWYEEGQEDGESLEDRREEDELGIKHTRLSTKAASPVGAADDDAYGDGSDSVRMRFEDSSGGGDSEPESPVSPHTPITGYHWTQQPRPCVSEPSTPTGGQHGQHKSPLGTASTVGGGRGGGTPRNGNDEDAPSTATATRHSYTAGERDKTAAASIERPASSTTPRFRKKASMKRRSMSLQRKSGSTYPILHQVTCKEVKRERRRRSVVEILASSLRGRGRGSSTGESGRKGSYSQRARSLEDIRKESSTAWILSASHVDNYGGSSRPGMKRRNSVSVVLSEMTARDILTDNMLENRTQEMRGTRDDEHFSSTTELDVFLNSAGINTWAWGDDKTDNLFNLLALLQSSKYQMREAGDSVELVRSTVQIRLVHGKTQLNCGKALHMIKRERGAHDVTLLDKKQKFPEQPKHTDASIESVCLEYLSEQLGMDLDDLEMVEGCTIRVLATNESETFPGLKETHERFIVEVASRRLLNRGMPFRTQILTSDGGVKETITWAWVDENYLLDEDITDGEPALREWLTTRGLDLREWGKDGNKSVYQLLVELLSGHCRLLDSVPPFRQCAFVNTRIWNEDKTRVLLETAEKPRRGRADVKNYYLSQKIAISDMMKDPSFSVDDIVADSILEKLFNDETSELDRIQSFNTSDLEHWGEFSISFESPSYPSLPSQYTVLTTDVIVEGLPDAESFETVEYEADLHGNPTEDVRTRHYWTWQPIDLTNHRISSKFFKDYGDEDETAIYHSESSLTHGPGHQTPIGPGAYGGGGSEAGGTGGAPSTLGTGGGGERIASAVEASEESVIPTPRSSMGNSASLTLEPLASPHRMADGALARNGSHNSLADVNTSSPTSIILRDIRPSEADDALDAEVASSSFGGCLPEQSEKDDGESDMAATVTTTAADDDISLQASRGGGRGGGGGGESDVDTLSRLSDLSGSDSIR